MQVQQQPRPHQQEIVSEKTDTTISDSRTAQDSGSEIPTIDDRSRQQEEDWSIEGLIFPQLLREGIGHRCYYCWTKTGYSVAFTSLGQYAKQVLYQHEGYSIYVFDEDVMKYKEELAALRRKQRDYPKLFKQPISEKAPPIKERYKKFSYKKRINNLASD